MSRAWDRRLPQKPLLVCLLFWGEGASILPRLFCFLPPTHDRPLSNFLKTPHGPPKSQALLGLWGQLSGPPRHSVQPATHLTDHCVPRAVLVLTGIQSRRPQCGASHRWRRGAPVRTGADTTNLLLRAPRTWTSEFTQLL